MFFKGALYAINIIDLIEIKNPCLTPLIRGNRRTIA
jgi:hypothetical protein